MSFLEASYDRPDEVTELHLTILPANLDVVPRTDGRRLLTVKTTRQFASQRIALHRLSGGVLLLGVSFREAHYNERRLVPNEAVQIIVMLPPDLLKRIRIVRGE